MPSLRTSPHCLRLIACAMTLATAAALSACAPLLVGGVIGGTAAVATDRRTTGMQVEDVNISLKVENQMRKNFGETARIDAAVYLGRVLLTGEAPSQAVKDHAAQLADQVENVKEVINQIRIAPVAPQNARTHDVWITSKVRTTLINTRGVPSRTIAVTTSDGVVYLMGKVTRIESDMAAAAAAGVGGVKQVVKVFNVMSPEEEAALARATGAANASSAAAPSPAPVTTVPTNAGTGVAEPAVEVIPVE